MVTLVIVIILVTVVILVIVVTVVIVVMWVILVTVVITYYIRNNTFTPIEKSAIISIITHFFSSTKAIANII